MTVGFLVMLELALPLSLFLTLYSELVVFPLFLQWKGVMPGSKKKALADPEIKTRRIWNAGPYSIRF